MTGTSLDGIDTALIETTGTGLDLQVTVIAHRHDPLGPAAPTLRSLADDTPAPASTIARAATALGESITAAIGPLAKTVDLTCIAVHGQTVHHRPPHTWQVLDAAPIVAGLGVPVVTSQRRGDLASGGRGAPLTPLADWILHRNLAPCLIVNLGGFANATALPASGRLEEVRGRDLCPCNHLLDTLAQRRLDSAFDLDGAHAASGCAHQTQADTLADALLDAADSTQAMGGDDRHLDLLDNLDALSGNDAAATLARALGNAIATGANSLGEGPLALAGGSVHHRPLVEAIHACAGRPVDLLAGHASREAAAMAVLALLELDGVPPSLPGVTGRRNGPTPGGLWMRPVG